MSEKTETVEQAIEAIRDKLRRTRNSFKKERQVENGIVLRMLRALGWPTDDVEVVIPQPPPPPCYPPVDFVLVPSEPAPMEDQEWGEADDKARWPVFLEAKALGKLADGEAEARRRARRQLFKYARDSYDRGRGVSILVLTDGREWTFYLPAVCWPSEGLLSQFEEWAHQRCHEDPGSPLSAELRALLARKPQQFCALNLLGHEIWSCADWFRRFLSREAVESGKALHEAQETFLRIRRETQTRMPWVWRRALWESKDLRDLLAGQLERELGELGAKPSIADVADFLRFEARPWGWNPDDWEMMLPQSALPPDSNGGLTLSYDGRQRLVGFKWSPRSGPDSHIEPRPRRHNVILAEVLKLLHKEVFKGDPKFFRAFAYRLEQDGKDSIVLRCPVPVVNRKDVLLWENGGEEWRMKYRPYKKDALVEFTKIACKIAGVEWVPPD